MFDFASAENSDLSSDLCTEKDIFESEIVGRRTKVLQELLVPKDLAASGGSTLEAANSISEASKLSQDGDCTVKINRRRKKKQKQGRDTVEEKKRETL